MTVPSIPIGILFSATGSYGTVGRTMLNGALLACRQVNEDPDAGVRLEPHVIDPASRLPAYSLTLFALLAAVLVSALFAAVLGYFLFFGRISGVFLGIVTLSVTLVLQCFMSQTAGPEWRIASIYLGEAHA